jgi:hypothetical protein
MKAEEDWQVFAIGLRWALLQIVLFTILTFILMPFWK